MIWRGREEEQLIGNKRCCHGMELHIQSDRTSDLLAKEQRKKQMGASGKGKGKCKKT
jgi:hypothetical protein